MTAYTKTITNRINCFGVAPSNKWNERNWNAFVWGEGTNDLQVVIGKRISESTTLTDAYTKRPTKLISETITPVGDLSSEVLRDGAGFRYVYPDRATDGESRDFTTWSATSSQSVTWTSGTVTATTWS